MTASTLGGGAAHGPRRIARLLGAAALALAAAACSEDGLVQPNRNNPSQEAIDANLPQAVQLRAAGILALSRDLMAGYVSDVGIHGRESFNYTPTELRNTLEYLTPTALTNASFNTGNWAGPYRNMRGMRDLIALVDRAEDNPFTPAEREATKGFANTMWAYELYRVIAVRDTLGAVVDIVDQQDSAAAFVRRDSVYRVILAKLDQGRTELQAGGGAFPFALTPGFAGFNTPATFAQVNRALHARVAAHLASFTRDADRYRTVLTSLGESFLDASPPADLDLGVYHVFSTASGDALNGVSPVTSPDQLAHPSVGTDAAPGDTRFATKVRRLPNARTGPPNGQSIPTDLQFTIYPTNTSPIPLIRNEELILLRAEARWFTGNAGGALADINLVRQRAGLAPRGAFGSAEEFVTELLAQRRYSLLFEGHRWLDVRRFGRLATLPLDVPTHIRAPWQPLPNAECDARALVIRRRLAAGDATANQPFTGLGAPSCPVVS